MEQNNDYIGCCIAEETAALTIEDRTLLKCVSDKNYVYIPDGVERIASNAFAECKNLYAICSRECLRENVMEVMHSCMLNCAYGTESWLEKRIDKYTNADMSLWLWEVSDVDYTYALQQCIRNSKYHNKAGNSIQWQSLSVDMNDLLNHTIDESIASQLPIILPTDPFRVMYSKRLEQAYSLPEEIARLGFGILRITGINKKELICNPQFNYLSVAEMHCLDGYGIVSPQWLIVMDMTSEIHLSFYNPIPPRISPYVDTFYDSMSVDKYMGMKRSQGKVV